MSVDVLDLVHRDYYCTAKLGFGIFNETYNTLGISANKKYRCGYYLTRSFSAGISMGFPPSLTLCISRRSSINGL